MAKKKEEEERHRGKAALTSMVEREQVNHPAHYGGDTTYEAIKVIEAWELGFCLGNAIKYISRAGKKPGSNPRQDVEKARWYVDRYLENTSGNTIPIEDHLVPIEAPTAKALQLLLKNIVTALTTIPTPEDAVELGDILMCARELLIELEGNDL